MQILAQEWVKYRKVLHFKLLCFMHIADVFYVKLFTDSALQDILFFLKDVGIKAMMIFHAVNKMLCQ